ncbi:carboxylating nicotinate-nucleotide diphosphorylase [Chloroflexota bacterium]
MNKEELSNRQIDRMIDLALAEDSGCGDITSRAIIPPQQQVKAYIVAKQDGVLAGVDVAGLVFHKVEPSLEVSIDIPDGAEIKAGDKILGVGGSAAPILMAERVALNLLSRLSGIATETARYTAEVKGTKAVIMDTRKTMPAMRLADKYAVRMGGGQNHRMHLGDGILIKDNHIEMLQRQGMKLNDIIARAKQNAPSGTKIEIEVDTIPQALEVAKAGADIVMLDNMPPEDMRQAVKLVAGKVKLEASGGINLDNVRAVAMTGVDYISIGAITHSVKAIDFSLEFAT